MDAPARICIRCGAEHNRRHRWCRLCFNKVSNERYHKKKKTETPEDRVKKRARWAINSRRKRGKYVPGSCVYCRTTEKIQLHHPDYSQPYLVVSLCERCHHTLHRGEKIQKAISMFVLANPHKQLETVE